MWAAAGMVTVLVVAVPASLFVPPQPATFQPVAGVAVNVMLSPVTYCPALQPVDLLGEASGSLPCPLWLRVNE